MRRKSEKGQAIILAVVAMGLVLVGALGLAIDGATLFGHRTMAQAAADAAAQAAALSILDMTDTAANGNDFTSSGAATPFTCDSSKAGWTPCQYAAANGFTQTSDTVAVSFPGASQLPGVSGLSPDFTPNAVRVTITRNVGATFMRLFGATSSNVSVTAVAAILQAEAPVPIIITHPTLSPSLTVAGTTTIKICGGPQKSIQVNSDGSVGVQGSKTVTLYPPGPYGMTVLGNGGTGVGNTSFDLSKGGPSDTSGNCLGTGTDMALSVSAKATPTFPFTILSGSTGTCANGDLCTGTTGHYYQGTSKIYDPLRYMAAPSDPGGTAPATQSINAGTGDCPTTATGGCTVYFPGKYPTGIGITGTTAIMNPGIYYISGAPNNGNFKGMGFATGSNGDIIMCSTNCVADTSGCCTNGNGMLVYLTNNGGYINVASNSQSTLVGSDLGSAFLGTLFFVARDAPAQSHSFGGGGALSIQGTIYATNCTPGITCLSPGTNMDSSTYQTISLLGGSGNGTQIRGEIITSVLNMGGGGSNGGITMNLNPNLLLPINQVALVQ
jgi:hypothetical protein